MSERDDRPADGTLDGESRHESAENAAEVGNAGAVEALDGAAAAGSLGAVGGGERDSVMPEASPDPSIGRD
jgi:hypothetical protein